MGEAIHEAGFDGGGSGGPGAADGNDRAAFGIALVDDALDGGGDGELGGGRGEGASGEAGAEERAGIGGSAEELAAGPGREWAHGSSQQISSGA